MSRKKILVVDDEKAFLHSVGRILKDTDFSVDTAGTLDEALDFCRRKSFDIVVTDIRLTDSLHQEGLDILQHVKTGNLDTKVVILTGYGSRKLMDDAYAMGADLYLEKPVSVHTLLKILENMEPVKS